jgi:hypothetical protein
MNDIPNGRVTTRDLLAAVEGAEERLTSRIDRLEVKVECKLDDHSTRLTVLETEQAIEDARSRDILRVVAGFKSFVLVAVAIASLAVGAIAAGIRW